MRALAIAVLAPAAVRGQHAGTSATRAALYTTDRATDPRASLRTSIDSLLDDPRFHNAFWGVLIVDPVHGDTLFARNADKLFIPASNMKLVTGSVALVRLGPDFRFRTVFASRGRLNQGVLDGDLVVIGRGDPTVSDHMMHDAMIPLRAAADSTVAHGIHSVTGRLISEGDAFPGNNVSAGWEWDDLTEAYGAGVDELMFNEGFTNIILHAGKRPGASAIASTTPLADYPPVRAHVRTAAPVVGSTTADLRVTFDAAHSAVNVEGALAPRDSTTLLVAYPDQTSAYLYAFADALRAAGITLRTQPVAAPAEAPAVSSLGELGAVTPAPLGHPIDTLFILTSPPLRDVLAAMLKPSQNQIAEVLLKTLGLEFTGVGLADSGRRVIESQLSAWGVPSDGYVIHDGSGLSRHDYVSPATLVRILTAMAGDSTFPAFYDALPIAGVDGTLETRMRATAAAGNVRAKTGSVDRARSLSGYVTTTDGTRLIFSMLCNNWTTPVHDVEQVQDFISARLASLDLAAK
jgi:D-alanyl-D-alanine carboxypeptidase/D-alanyl-D-alanine-endopeptidase (penicillin-binding protein 4)